MTELVEIQDAIQHLPPRERAEVRHWIPQEETPEMLAAIDVGIRSAETEPKLSADRDEHAFVHRVQGRLSILTRLGSSED